MPALMFLQRAPSLPSSSPSLIALWTPSIGGITRPRRQLAAASQQGGSGGGGGDRRGGKRPPSGSGTKSGRAGGRGRVNPEMQKRVSRVGQRLGRSPQQPAAELVKAAYGGGPEPTAEQVDRLMRKLASCGSARLLIEHMDVTFSVVCGVRLGSMSRAERFQLYIEMVPWLEECLQRAGVDTRPRRSKGEASSNRDVSEAALSLVKLHQMCSRQLHDADAYPFVFLREGAFAGSEGLKMDVAALLHCISSEMGVPIFIE